HARVVGLGSDPLEDDGLASVQYVESVTRSLHERKARVPGADDATGLDGPDAPDPGAERGLDHFVELVAGTPAVDPGCPGANEGSGPEGGAPRALEPLFLESACECQPRVRIHREPPGIEEPTPKPARLLLVPGVVLAASVRQDIAARRHDHGDPRLAGIGTGH